MLEIGCFLFLPRFMDLTSSTANSALSSSTLVTTADFMRSDPNSEADFLSQAGLSRSALQQLADILELKRPSDGVLLSACEQILKTTVRSHCILGFYDAKLSPSSPLMVTRSSSTTSYSKSSLSLHRTRSRIVVCDIPLCRNRRTFSSSKAFVLALPIIRSFPVPRKVCFHFLSFYCKFLIYHCIVIL